MKLRGPILIRFLFIIICELISTVIFMTYWLALLKFGDLQRSIIFLSLQIILTIFVIHWFIKKESKKELCFSKPDISFLLPAIVLTVFIFILVSLSADLLGTPDKKIPFLKNFVEINGNNNYYIFNYTFLSLLIAPVREEILFRGLLQKAFQKRFNPCIAVVLAAMLFSLFHFSIAKIPYTLAGGILYGFFYYKTNKLIIPVLCHFCWNLIYSILTFYKIRMDEEWMFIPLLITGVVSLWYIFCFYSSKIRNHE